MAAKVIFLLALTAVVVNAQRKCICDPKTEMENKALWKFLTKLSTEANDPQDKEMKAVLPGVLSPLLDCNCLMKNRRKRMIPKEVYRRMGVLQSQRTQHVRQKKSINYLSPRCPKGQVWFGIVCVPLELLD